MAPENGTMKKSLRSQFSAGQKRLSSRNDQSLRHSLVGLWSLQLGEPTRKGASTEIFAQTAIDFLNSQKDASNPFFCYVAFTGWPRKPEEIQMFLSDYHALVTHLGSQIAKITQTPKDNGQYENTLIAYTVDSGIAVGSHGLLS